MYQNHAFPNAPPKHYSKILHFLNTPFFKSSYLHLNTDTENRRDDPRTHEKLILKKNYLSKNLQTFTVKRFLLCVNGHNWNKFEIEINGIGLFLVFVVGNCGTENRQVYKKSRANGEIFLDPILKQNQKSHFILLDEKGSIWLIF